MSTNNVKKDQAEIDSLHAQFNTALDKGDTDTARALMAKAVAIVKRDPQAHM